MDVQEHALTAQHEHVPGHPRVHGGHGPLLDLHDTLAHVAKVSVQRGSPEAKGVSQIVIPPCQCRACSMVNVRRDGITDRDTIDERGVRVKPCNGLGAPLEQPHAGHVELKSRTLDS